MILGPSGGVLVLEVKGGELRKLSTTGRWEGPDRDHPMNQLYAEWKAVLTQLQETAEGKAVPFVAKALCLTDLTIDPKIPTYKEIDRNLIVDRVENPVGKASRLTLFGPGCPESKPRRLTYFLLQNVSAGLWVTTSSGVIRETGSGNLPLETVRCLDQKVDVRQSNLPNKMSPRDFRRLMKVGGFFLCSWCVIHSPPTNEHPQNSEQILRPRFLPRPGS